VISTHPITDKGKNIFLLNKRLFGQMKKVSGRGSKSKKKLLLQLPKYIDSYVHAHLITK
jgi:hypothetical protein